jgi:hypothetical protein
MTTMSRAPATFRAALVAAGILVSFPGAAQGGACPPPAPVLSGPASASLFEGYTITWKDVLVPRPSGPADIYVVERSEDPKFVEGVERYQTNRTSASFGAPLGSPRTIHHRVAVKSSCAGTTPIRSDSQTLSISFLAICPTPIALQAPTISPASPPAFTTYVVSWDTLGAGEPGPGGGAQGLRFRLRRTGAGEIWESIVEGGTAAFTDGPGEFLYQVRTENQCGETGEWSKAVRVVVGERKTASLGVVASPRPTLLPADAPGTGLIPVSVRSTGTEPLDVRVEAPEGVLSVSPSAFRLTFGESREVAVRVLRSLDPAAPLHTAVTFVATGVSLRVPIDVAADGPAADLPAGWDVDASDVDRAGNSFQRYLVNPGSRMARVVASISADWVRISSLDGRAWDRPLAPGEVRPVTVEVDRAKRRAAIGTEVATVTIVTAGHADAPKSLSVLDDGPLLSGTGAPTASDDLPPLYLMKSRLLFPSLPNVVDARGVGRYTSDLWLSNVDALSPIKVLLTLTPAGQGNTSAGVRQFVFSLGPGETRRFRNVVGTVFGFEGACSLDVSSPAATLSATAMVNNKPLVPLVAGKTAALSTAVAGTVLSSAEFGFEMRPVSVGEGANGFDPTYVVSGLRHDDQRRTNLILRETTGNETVVRLELFDRLGRAVQKDGADVSFEITVPAAGSLQVNDDVLFPAESLPGSAWAKLTFVRGVVDPFGRNRGAVVPFATVIDAGTQDASLRVGVSTTALAPAGSESAAVKTLSTGLPFNGDAEPLYFPVAHVSGAALSTGATPKWRTRVTLSNVSETEQRVVRLTFQDKSGRYPGGSVSSTVGLLPGFVFTFEDVLEDAFSVPADSGVWGTITADNVKRTDGTWQFTWTDVDVQTETYTADTEDASLGEFRTGMEGYSYQHGYSSFQSNLGTVLIDGAETSPRNRTNLILQEVGGATCSLGIALYPPGTIVPIATTFLTLQPGDYVSRELFRDLMKLDLEEVVDARVVVRQMDGDGVFMAFVSKINLVTGDPANVFLRPASAGTGR